VTGLHRGLLLLALAGALPASAGPSLVIYRCVAADGAVTLQNGSKCPKGAHQQKRVVETPAPAPMATPARVATPAPIAAVPTPAAPARGATPDAAAVSGGTATPAADANPAAPTPRLPPPMLYACLTADAQRYFSDTAESSRCAPLEAVGLDGRSAGAGEACEVVQDRCEPVAEAERCAAWAERRRVAEQAMTFVPEQLDTARTEIARVDAATEGTACAR
jgi:hypothetical protein